MDLFIMTTKLTKTKAVAGVLAGGVLLCAVIFTAGHTFEKNAGGPPSPASVSDNAQRVAYLAGWGWEVEPSAVETLDLTFPETLDEAYLSYNELQMENGMDLTGQTLFVCTAPADVGLADPPPQREIIVSGPRIGVDYAEEARDFPWRFQLKKEDG